MAKKLLPIKPSFLSAILFFFAIAAPGVYADAQDYELWDLTKQIPLKNHLLNYHPEFPPLKVALPLSLVPENELLGKGSYGFVFAARNLQTKMTYAVKVITLNDQRFGFPSICESIAAETVVGFLNHPGINRLHASYAVSLPSPGLAQVYLLMDLQKRNLKPGMVARGALDQYKLEWIRVFLYRSLCPLAYLHKVGLVHGDLNGANILLGEDDRPRLADFSTLHREGDLVNRDLSHHVFRAPELQARLAKNSQGKRYFFCSCKNDIFSMGIVFAELLLGIHSSQNLFAGNQYATLIRYLQFFNQLHRCNLTYIPRCNFSSITDLDYLEDLVGVSLVPLKDPPEVTKIFAMLSKRCSNDPQLGGTNDEVMQAMQLLSLMIQPNPRYRGSVEGLLAQPFFAGLSQKLAAEEEAAITIDDAYALHHACKKHLKFRDQVEIFIANSQDDSELLREAIYQWLSQVLAPSYFKNPDSRSF